MIPFSEYFQHLRDWLDLNIQLDVAYWTKASALVSMGALFASIAAVYAAFKTLKNSQRLGQQQNQAYVHASAVMFGDFQNIVVECHNSGLTPATQFSLNATAKVVKRGNVTASIEFRDNDFKTWSALGSQQKLTVSVLDGDDTVQSFRTAQKNNEDILLVCGQIVYCTIFNEDYVSQFAFFVDHKKNNRFRRPTSNLTVFERVKSPPPR
ncbi:hypothetical protein [Brucella pituitosa]|uniref:hypothetical protein n=1 Tax=Brucella pituitosa TaxID=571256 RepID=UPI000C277DF6|nr:hypothetical protein [Brucella pituitosa]PJO47210.1 hypothetical protein CWE02_19295 [Brucella pituitosa]